MRETIHLATHRDQEPVDEGTLGLSTWQKLFFCEVDGPRSDRRVVVTVMADG